MHHPKSFELDIERALEMLPREGALNVVTVYQDCLSIGFLLLQLSSESYPPSISLSRDSRHYPGIPFLFDSDALP